MSSRPLIRHLLVAASLFAAGFEVRASVSFPASLGSNSCNAADGWLQGGETILSCAGDAALQGGSWESLSALVIRADGDLWLSDVRITAPGIELQARTLRIDANASLSAPGGLITLLAGESAIVDGTLSAGGTLTTGGVPVVIVPGQNIGPLPDRNTPLSPVPEPQLHLMWLAGLGLLVSRLRNKSPVEPVLRKATV